MTFYVCFTDQRIDDIKFWQKEVDDKLDGIKKEIDALGAFQARIDKAIESCKEPLHIAQQCLANRYTNSRLVDINISVIFYK